MKKWIIMCSVFVAVLMCCPRIILAEDEECGNHDNDCHEECSTNECGKETCETVCPEGGSNPFSLYSGNATREIRDIALSVQVGSEPLRFTRYFQSRPEWNATDRSDYFLGQGGNWRHSYQWTLMDDGVKNGEQSIQIIRPSGESLFYYKKATNDLFMTADANIHARILPDGTNYYLYMLDGTRYHITEKIVDSNKLFRMEGFQDPYSNQYVFVYNTNDVLQKVTSPNTNQYFEFSYSRMTNAVDPGIIRFTYIDTNAVQVLLPGTWNDWAGADTPMTLTDGVWQADVELAEGFYQYKFLITDASSNQTWVTDPDNPLVVGPGSNSLVIVDTGVLLRGVTASDGRAVEYEYGYFWNDASGVLDACLTGAVYDAETRAEYTYYPAAYDQGRMPLMKSADDPMYSGPGRAVFYLYHTNRPYSGQIYEERSLVNSQLFGRLEFDDTRPGYRKLTDADGEVTEFQYSTISAQLYSITNAVGYAYQNIFYGGDGMLWKSIDPLGRTTVYTRTWQFGAILSVSNSSCDCAADSVNTYTDETYPFYLASKTDAEGYVTTYTRDARHRPTRIDYPDGTYETFDYNEYGQVLVERKRDGSIWNYTYDDRGRQASELAPDNGLTTFSYDSYDRLSSVTNALGETTIYTYNDRGLITRTDYPDGTYETRNYDRYGLVTQEVSRTGGTTVRTYDALGQLASITDPSGAVTLMHYDADGRLITQTTPDGLIISNTYDGIGRKIRETYSSDGTTRQWLYSPDGVTSIVNRLGFTKEQVYDDEGRLASVTDERGNTTRYTYDDLGRKTAVANALNQTNLYTYDPAGRTVSILTDQGLVTNTYSNGRLIRTVNPGGITNEMDYDATGRVVARYLNGYLIQSNRYDLLGRSIWNQDANALITSNTYNAAGQLIRSYRPNGTYAVNIYSNTLLMQTLDYAGRKTTITRDAAGRVLTQTDNASNIIHYAYTPSGLLTNLTDQAGNQTAWTYDMEGRQLAKRYADGTVWQYGYDAEGHLISREDALGQLTQYAYDPAGNLTNINYAADADVSYAYDALNRKTRMTDGLGTTDYTYVECCSRLDSEDGPYADDELVYTYDEAGRLTNSTLSTVSEGYAYDALGRLQIVTAAEGDYTYAYLGNGRMEASLLRPNGVETVKAYDSLMRLTNIIHASTGSVLSSYGITVDDADQRTRIMREDGRRIEYTYDPIGQLVAAKGYLASSDPWPGYQYGYQFDETGNPVEQDKNGLIRSNTFNSLNQNLATELAGTLAALGTANYPSGTVSVNGLDGRLFTDGTFAVTNIPFAQGTNTLTAVHSDPYGRSTTNLCTVTAADRTYGYDLNGNLTNDGEFAYVWDNENRLTEIRRASDNALIQKNSYDGLGRRREKVVYDSTGTVTNRYLYRGWLVMAITDGTTNRLETYTHGNDLSGSLDGAGGIGGILSQTTGGALSPASVQYLLYDFNGNVTGLTDSEGQSAARYEYSPFGEVLLHTGSASTRFQFSTKEYDSAVRLNYYGYRFYSPELGRWLSRDPLGDESFFIMYSKNILRRDVRRLRTQQMQPLYVLVRNVPIIEHDALGLLGDDDDDGDEPPTCYTKDDIPDWVNDQLPQDALDRLNKCCIGPCCPGILWGGGVRGACIKCTF